MNEAFKWFNLIHSLLNMASIIENLIGIEIVNHHGKYFYNCYIRDILWDVYISSRCRYTSATGHQLCNDASFKYGIIPPIDRSCHTSKKG